MHSITSLTVRTSVINPRERALAQPIICPVCSEKLSPPVHHSCSFGNPDEQDSILQDLSAIALYLQAGSVMPSARSYFGRDGVAA